MFIDIESINAKSLYMEQHLNKCIAIQTLDEWSASLSCGQTCDVQTVKSVFVLNPIQVKLSIQIKYLLSLIPISIKAISPTWCCCPLTIVSFFGSTHCNPYTKNGSKKLFWRIDRRGTRIAHKRVVTIAAWFLYVKTKQCAHITMC